MREAVWSLSQVKVSVYSGNVNVRRRTHDLVDRTAVASPTKGGTTFVLANASTSLVLSFPINERVHVSQLCL